MIQNVFTNTLKALMDIFVGITQYFVSRMMQPLIPERISLMMNGGIMLRTIQFDYKLGRCNVKINNVISQWLLSVNCDG